MNTETFDSFRADALAQGFDEVLVREWLPGQTLATHVHPFAVQAHVVHGELALTVEGQTRVLHAGDGFELRAEQPHAEQYGPQGATFWVARRHISAP